MEQKPVSELQKWMRSILISGGVFVFFSIYLFLRRGYYNPYIINKVFGSTAAVIAGFTLLIGPLSSYFSLVARASIFCRHLGLLAFGLGILHVLFSTVVLPNKFPLSWYQKEWIPVAFGILALLIWSYLVYLSQNKKIQEMGGTLWKKHQSIGGHIAFWAIYLHLTVMKWPGWMKWINGGVKQTPELANPGYPPASTFVFLFMSGVILYRIGLKIYSRTVE